MELRKLVLNCRTKRLRGVIRLFGIILRHKFMRSAQKFQHSVLVNIVVGEVRSPVLQEHDKGNAKKQSFSGPSLCTVTQVVQLMRIGHEEHCYWWLFISLWSPTYNVVTAGSDCCFPAKLIKYQFGTGVVGFCCQKSLTIKIYEGLAAWYFCTFNSEPNNQILPKEALPATNTAVWEWRGHKFLQLNIRMNKTFRWNCNVKTLNTCPLHKAYIRDM